MKILLCIFLFFVVSKKDKISVAPPTVVANTQAIKTINYDSCKIAIHSIKQKQKVHWQKISTAQQEKIFVNAVIQTIIPAWIGTPWDFNGVTQTPQQGKIACGYFVTTVLRDAGVELQRIKLAQAASQKIITTLALKKDIKLCCNKSIENFVQLIKSTGYGLYVVGLDNHTGFIYNDGKEVYFIHSSVMGTRNVQKEIAAYSKVLTMSKYKIVGKISANNSLLNRWINSN